MIVTGCQRSGTMTMASILGIGHERQFSVREAGILLSYGVSSIKQIQSESSWLAQPFIKIFKQRKISVIHLVRHPLNVISSLLGIGFFESNVHKLYLDFLEYYLPSIKNIKDHTEKAMYYYVYWNKPLNGYPQIQIEHIHNAPILNARKRKFMAWTDIPQTSLKSEVEELAAMYGYAFS